MNLEETIKCVIFDLDGTIIDSERMIAVHLHKFFEKLGIEYSEELRLKTLGQLNKDIHEMLVKEYNLNISFKEYQQEKHKFDKQYLQDCPLTLGAEKLINHLHAQGIPLAIATNSFEDEVEYRMKNHKQILEKFHHVTTPEGLNTGKPDPEIYHECLSRFSEHYDPEETLVFEDSLTGGTAAVRAGMNVIFVQNSIIFTEADKKPFTKCINSLEEFDPAEFGLGYYESANNNEKSCTNNTQD